MERWKETVRSDGFNVGVPLLGSVQLGDHRNVKQEEENGTGKCCDDLTIDFLTST